MEELAHDLEHDLPDEDGQMEGMTEEIESNSTEMEQETRGSGDDLDKSDDVQQTVPEHGLGTEEIVETSNTAGQSRLVEKDISAADGPSHGSNNE